MIDHGGLLMTCSTADYDLIAEYDDAVRAAIDLDRKVSLAKSIVKPIEEIGRLYGEAYKAQQKQEAVYDKLRAHFSEFQLELIHMMMPDLRKDIDDLALLEPKRGEVDQKDEIRWYQCTDLNNFYSMTKDQSWKDDGSKPLDALLIHSQRDRIRVILTNGVEFVIRDGTLIPDESNETDE